MRLSALMSDDGRPVLVMNNRCARVASTRVGTGSFTIGATSAERRDGGMSQGAEVSSSSSPLVRTPSTCPFRWVSAATRSTVEGAMRCTPAKYAHWSGKTSKSSSTNTVLSFARGPCWSGSAIRFPKPRAAPAPSRRHLRIGECRRRVARRVLHRLGIRT